MRTVQPQESKESYRSRTLDCLIRAKQCQYNSNTTILFET
jgi:hypothetical protein